MQVIKESLLSNLHIEYTSAILRVYKSGGYEDRSKFSFVATMMFIDDTIYIKGGLGKLDREDFISLKETIGTLGYESFKFEKNGKWKTHLINAKQGLKEA